MDVSLEEVSMILLAFDKLIQAGGLRIGDFTIMAPLITKLLARLPKKPPEPEFDATMVADTPEEPFTIPVPIKKEGDAN